MIKKLTVYTILVSMTLNCACRLGFVDHLYKNRNEIAYSLGLIAEIPLALCSSDYDYGKTFKLESNEDSGTVLPSIVKAEHINLFIVTVYSHPDAQKILIDTRLLVTLPSLYNLIFSNPVFHPPSEVV